jgi:hypothetical protein
MFNENIILDPNKFKKSNILIDIRRSEIFKVWSENEHKLLNSLLYMYSQKTETEIEELKKGYCFISLSSLRDLMNLSSKNDYKSTILNSLKLIRDFGFNARYNGSLFYTSFIWEFNLEELQQLTQNNKNQQIRIKFNDTLFECILQKKDYTLLNKDINKLNSKYAMNIYQIIKMKQKQINPHTNKRLTEISYNLKELNEIFNTSHKFISKFKHHFENRKKSIVSKSLIGAKNFDFEFKKDCIVFKFRNFNKKSK